MTPAPPNDLDALCVYRVVAAGESAGRVRRAIVDCVQGSAWRRAAAVNSVADGETPLEAALRLQGGDLVGLLVEAGADPGKPFEGDCGPTVLALCCTCGQVESVRGLLLAGHDPGERFTCSPCHREFAFYGHPCTALDVCLAPPRLLPSSAGAAAAAPAPPQLACLEALVQEGGADVRAAGSEGTPLHTLTRHAALGGDYLAALDLLLRSGTDVHAPSPDGLTPICACACRGDLAGALRLLEHSASVDRIVRGISPLMLACFHVDRTRDGRELALEFARRSSPETRRAVGAQVRPGQDGSYGGRSAVDVLLAVRADSGLPLEPWRERLIGELLADVAPVTPGHVARVLPIAASHAARREDEVVAWRAEPRGWRAHQAMVGLALDARELREAERAVGERRARLAEFGRGARGAGSGSGSENDDDGSEEEEEGDGSEEDEREQAAGREEGGGGK